MSLFEALSEGLRVTVIGLIIVFSVLIILMLIMMAMKVIFYRKGKTEEKIAAPLEVVPEKSVDASEMDEEELIAVLTAAVAASMNTSTYHLNIKSYKRIGNSAPSWNQAGLRDVIDARF